MEGSLGITAAYYPELVYEICSTISTKTFYNPTEIVSENVSETTIDVPVTKSNVDVPLDSSNPKKEG
jgi:hypothetical protein